MLSWVCDPLCTLKLNEEKSKHIGLSQQKRLWPASQFCAQFPETGWEHSSHSSKAVHRQRRVVTYDLALAPCVSDGSIMMIGTSGLPLVVVSYLPICSPSFRFLWVRLQKKWITKPRNENFFPGSHTSWIQLNHSPIVNHNCFAGKPNLELMMMGGPNPSLNGVS